MTRTMAEEFEYAVTITVHTKLSTKTELSENALENAGFRVDGEHL